MAFSNFQPTGWHTVTPRIIVNGAEKLVEFVKKVFGATGEYHSQATAELRLGDSIIMISDAGARDPMPACLYVYVESADITWQRAIQAGAQSIEPPLNTPYGDRRGMVKDPWGNTWQIATRRRSAPPPNDGSSSMPHTTVTVTIYREGSICFIPVNFDPKALFGKIRAPVKVTLNGYTYRSTIASMGGVTGIPLRKSNREAAGLAGGERIAVTIELDAEPREVELPRDLARALRSDKHRLKKWQSLSYTNRREKSEAIENAKRPATRERRLAAALKSLDDE